ncbi:MAG TPA: methyltransferase domain-containing protein [Blastocatellia bacterium]|nr:methyltransferase domain-containing protein [Blastocatellia bacterium]HMZ20839.1 methyltransferase domain-containing protein [Blastocatellia bacterium]HNG29041.1 methyltransferase domain-containing protein [Blastocatellia bacterium]
MSSQTSNQHLPQNPAGSFAEVMKNEWNERARENSKWYINTVRLDQTEEEFDATGLNEINTLILPELALLTEGRDPKELKFLEIGCGIGRMTKHLAGIFGEVHSTDVSGEMIRQARERLGTLLNVHLHETNGVDFAALPSEYFDIAFSAYVFQHVPSKEFIASNIREAYRAIKPGGILRVHTNGVEAQSYADAEKNTWAGATFTESELRQLARELGAQLVSIYGANSLFCWTMMRKPKGKSRSAPHIPKIEFHARADNPTIRVIPTGGDQAWLSLIVSGLDRESADANNLKVTFGSKAVVPRYAGRLRPHFESEATKQVSFPLHSLIYIEAAIPPGLNSGAARVRVLSMSGNHGLLSSDYKVEMVEAQPTSPKIVTVRNGHDYQTDIHAGGPKSSLRLFVEGLDDSATVENVKVKVGEHLISPTFVGFVTDIAGYQVDAQLPGNIAPGATTLELIFSGVASEAVAIEIKGVSD